MKVPCLLFRICICWKMYRHISSVPISIPYFIIQKKIHPLRSLARRPGKSVIYTRTISITLISDYKNGSLYEEYTNPGHLATRTTKSCIAKPNILDIIFLILLYIRTKICSRSFANSERSSWQWRSYVTAEFCPQCDTYCV